MEDKTKAGEKIRPTKKQKELLSFIETFQAEHGYSPSYREIMSGLNYTSVATVSLHVNNLIKRGHLRKREHSARSLEVVNPELPAAKPKLQPKQLNIDQEKWLVGKVEIYFKEAEASAVNEKTLEQLETLVSALKVLGASGAANAFNTRLTELKQKPESNKYAV